MADTDAHAAWNGDADRSAARDDAVPSYGRSPSPRGATPPPRRERERSRSPIPRRNGDDDGRGRPSHGGHDSNPGNNLHVSGVSNKVTDRDLSEAFSKYGVVTKAQVMYDPHTREPRGFAFVTFEKAEDAEAAMAALSGTDFFGRRISIEKARRGRARTPTPGRYYGPPKKGPGGGHNDRRYEPLPYDSRYGGPPPPPPRGGYLPPVPPRDPYDRYGPPPPGRPLSPPPLRDPYDRYSRGPPRDYPPRDRDFLPPPRGLPADYPPPPPRDYGRGPPPPGDYPPPRAYGGRDISPPPRSRAYDDIPPPPRGGSRYGDLPPPPPRGSRYDDIPPRRY